MSKEFLKQRDNCIRWDGHLRAYAVILSFEVFTMLTVKERHQIERDSRAPYIYEALKREGLVDETNLRTKSLKEIYAYIKTNDVKIGGKDCPIIFVSRADVEYTFKKFEIKGRKAGRKVKSVKADTDADLPVTSTSDTTPVDTDNCTSSESDHSEKSVSTAPVIANKISPIIRKVNTSDQAPMAEKPRIVRRFVPSRYRIQQRSVA